MKVLLTGAFGNVGSSTLEELLKKKHEIRVFELDNSKNRKLAKKYPRIEFVWGDIREKKEIIRATSNVNSVIHTAAIIPPLADKNPEFACSVNVIGTLNLINAMQTQCSNARIIYTSSISVYGNRLENPFIKLTDKPNPNDNDAYAKQKLLSEENIKHSNLDWTIFRLTYVASPDKLKMDPLMFDMPLNTSIEICHTKDVGRALANAIDKPETRGEIMNIAGGEKCRTSYREHLNDMFEIFGLGREFLPEEAFAQSGFHCGFLDTTESQKHLQYQRHTLGDYYKEVKKQMRHRRPFLKCAKPIVRAYLLGKSPYYK